MYFKEKNLEKTVESKSIEIAFERKFITKLLFFQLHSTLFKKVVDMDRRLKEKRKMSEFLV